MSDVQNNLINLIEKLPEIKSLFKAEYHSLAKPAGRPPIQSRFMTIRKHPKYMEWKAEIEYEIDLLPSNSTIEDVKRLFKKIDGGWSEDTYFDQLESKLEVLKKFAAKNNLCSPETNIGMFEENILCTNILKALVNIQKNPIYKGKKEDEINDGIRDNLSMIYETKDQTRQGESESGKSAGEVDLLICNQGLPVAIIEALRLPSLDQENLDKHINKALEKYDPVGCPHAFIFTFATGKDFLSFWNKFYNYLQNYQFPYDILNDVEEISLPYSESRYAKVSLGRSGCPVNVHFYVIHVY